jgi:hypothetical protein
MCSSRFFVAVQRRQRVRETKFCEVIHTERHGSRICSVKYQQRFCMEPLLKLVYQQWFIGRTAVDISISTTVVPMNRC